MLLRGHLSELDAPHQEMQIICVKPLMVSGQSCIQWQDVRGFKATSVLSLLIIGLDGIDCCVERVKGLSKGITFFRPLMRVISVQESLEPHIARA